MQVFMFHNPKCSKSRQTLALLNKKGVTPEIILYLKNPPTKSELSEILKKLKMEAKHLIRFKEGIASELDISLSDERSDAAWIKLMVENPKLIERPIVVTSKKAIIGRPPEKVLEIL